MAAGARATLPAMRRGGAVAAWIVYALLAAVFAAIVAVLGKVGVRDVDPTTATAVVLHG